jgi:hypothetical protein
MRVVNDEHNHRWDNNMEVTLQAFTTWSTQRWYLQPLLHSTDHAEVLRSSLSTLHNPSQHALPHIPSVMPLINVEGIIFAQTSMTTRKRRLRPNQSYPRPKHLIMFVSPHLYLVHDTTRVHNLVPLTKRLERLLRLVFIKRPASSTATQPRIDSSDKWLNIRSIISKQRTIDKLS